MLNRDHYNYLNHNNMLGAMYRLPYLNFLSLLLFHISSIYVRCSLHLKVKVHGVSLDMHRV